MKLNTVLTLMMVALASPLLAGETVDRTLPANQEVEVMVENIAGEVIVETWGRNEVRILANLGDDVEELEIEGDEDGYSFVVETDDERGWGRRNNREIASDLHLWVPVGSFVQTETVSASNSVSGVQGGLEVESVSGDVELLGVGGGIEAETVSGGLHVEATGGSVSAEAVSGKVNVSGASGEIYAASVSGAVNVSGSAEHELNLETVSGSITFEGSLASGAEVEAESVSGSIKLVLPAGLAADFEIETFSGTIDSDFGGTAERHSKYAPGQSLSYSTGSDVEISIETLSGSVSLVSR